MITRELTEPVEVHFLFSGPMYNGALEKDRDLNRLFERLKDIRIKSTTTSEKLVHFDDLSQICKSDNPDRIFDWTLRVNIFRMESKDFCFEGHSIKGCAILGNPDAHERIGKVMDFIHILPHAIPPFTNVWLEDGLRKFKKKFKKAAHMEALMHSRIQKAIWDLQHPNQ